MRPQHPRDVWNSFDIFNYFHMHASCSAQRPAISDLAKAITDLGEPAFRATQVTKWLYQKRVDGFDGMLNVSKASRLKFQEYFQLTNCRSRRS